MSKRSVCLGFLLAGFLALSADAQPLKGKRKLVVPAQEWGAVVKDEKLAKEAPRSPVLTDPKTFEKVWKAWRPTERLPDVNFKTKFVYLSLSLGGPNRPRVGAALDDEGNLTVNAESTLIGGPGFGYSLAVFERKGVKKVNGKALPAGTAIKAAS